MRAFGRRGLAASGRRAPSYSHKGTYPACSGLAQPHGGALPPAAPDWQRRPADVRGPRRCRLGSPVALTEASCGPTVGRMAARKRPTRCAYTAALAVVKTAASMDIDTWLGL